jgi:hypothetical protein
MGGGGGNEPAGEFTFLCLKGIRAMNYIQGFCSEENYIGS